MMRTKKVISQWAENIDQKYGDWKTQYGAYKTKSFWRVNLWQPLAQKVFLVIFDKQNPEQEIKRIEGKFNKPNWTWLLKDDWEGYFYQYCIHQQDGQITYALDPFAKSMAPFNWEGRETKVGKGAFVNFLPISKLYKIESLKKLQPIIYETHVRDLTSLRKDVQQPGSFKAVSEIKLGLHLNDLGFNTIQFLPLHSCYSLDDKNQTILKKGKGNGWITNYNWGYDPHNYFSVNGWYSTHPNDPYNRMDELKQMVAYFHSHKIRVVIDVVYNHLMTNSILNNILPDYYFRDGSDAFKTNFPVSYAPLASERIMVKRLIYDSLEWWVKNYDIDGFRFDLASFIDKNTITLIAKKLRKIKPNLLLHGEAWQWSDLNYNECLIKGITDNELNFAYFNDSTRNAIKGEDDDPYQPGIGIKIEENKFSDYLAGIIGNIKDFPNAPSEMSKNNYVRFTTSPYVSLQYAACHDGHTLWDKINLTVSGSWEVKIERLRQAILMQLTTQGQQLFLGGTEILYSKPHDLSGEDNHKFHKSNKIIDPWSLGDAFSYNSYKTTDWVNGLKWDQLKKDVKTNVYSFLKKLINFRLSTPFFQLLTATQIQRSVKFHNVSLEFGIIDFFILIKNKKLRVIHNFGSKNYNYKSEGKIIFNSKISGKTKSIVEAHSSQIILENYGITN